jgi:hypothetical protein
MSNSNGTPVPTTSAEENAVKALRADGIEAELYHTGGGCMVAAVAEGDGLHGHEHVKANPESQAQVFDCLPTDEMTDMPLGIRVERF